VTDPKQEARDPNTPPKRLAELLYGCTDDVLENPALPLILLENPGWLSELDTERLLKVLLRPNLPDYLVRALSMDSRQPIIINAGMHVALGEDVTDWVPLLRNLGALHCSKEDRPILERHGMIPDWLKPYLPPVPPPTFKRRKPAIAKPFIPLSEEEAEAILSLPERQRSDLADATRSASVLRLLSFDTSKGTLYSTARNAKTRLEDLLRLRANPHCWNALAQNPSVSAEFLEELAEVVDSTSPYSVTEILESIVRHPNCTLALAKRLESRGVGEGPMSRFRTSTELEALFLSGKPWVATVAKCREDAPQWLVAEGVMHDIWTRRAYLSWFCGLLVTNDEKRITSNVRSANWFTRLAIALRDNVKPKTLEKLTDDANRYVRFVARARLRDTDWVFPPA
jgi:hypothetical protein